MHDDPLRHRCAGISNRAMPGKMLPVPQRSPMALYRQCGRLVR